MIDRLDSKLINVLQCRKSLNISYILTWTEIYKLTNFLVPELQ